FAQTASNSGSRSLRFWLFRARPLTTSNWDCCYLWAMQKSLRVRARLSDRTRRKRRAGSAARDRLAVAAGVSRIIPPSARSPQGRRLGRAQSPFEPATARPTARRITRRSAAEARSYPPPLSVGQLLSTG